MTDAFFFVVVLLAGLLGVATVWAWRGMTRGVRPIRKTGAAPARNMAPKRPMPTIDETRATDSGPRIVTPPSAGEGYRITVEPISACQQATTVVLSHAPRETYVRQAVRYSNICRQGYAQLVGVASGLLADGQLSDEEIRFLNDWLERHDDVAAEWPGNAVQQRVRIALAEGTIGAEERAHLVTTLEALIGDDATARTNSSQVTALAFDEVEQLEFAGRTFCFTGDFVFAPRTECEKRTEARGGLVRRWVSKKSHYVVVGSLGSPEWKHGSFGTKIEAAMRLKQRGTPIRIVREDVWSSAL